MWRVWFLLCVLCSRASWYVQIWWQKWNGRNDGSFDEFKGRAFSWLVSQLEKIKWQRLKAFSCHVYSTAKFAKWAVSVCRSACLFLSWRTWLRRNYHGYGVSSFCFIPRFFDTVIVATFDRVSLLFRRRNFSRCQN